MDSLPNDRDDFIKAIANGQLAGLSYDPIGLDANLAIAEGLIKATLLEGDYLATHAFGWTQFEIDPTSQMLTVTTYGIDATPRTNSSPAPPPSPPVSPASLAASRSSPKGCRWCHPSHCCSPGCSF